MDDATIQHVGRFRLLKVLGSGSAGIVYKAHDTERDVDVALKLMRPEIVSDPQARSRFAREARPAAGLRHRNIVSIIDYSGDGDRPYIAMELLSGTSLADAMANGAHQLSLDKKLDIVIQLCDGLQFAHERGVIHRDVKPANIWLLKNGQVKLLDFGIAKLVGTSTTLHGTLLGSVAYMAPEQLADKPVDGRADIFSAGVVLYELITGHCPFEADTVTGVMMKVLREAPPPLRVVAPDVAIEIVQAIETAMQKDPSLRYAEAADFGADLRLSRDLAVSLPAQPDTVIRVPAPDVIAYPAPMPTPDPTLEIGALRSPSPSVEKDADLVLHKAAPVPTPAVTVAPKPRTNLIAAVIGIVVAIALAAAWTLWPEKPAPQAFVLEVQSVPAGAAIEVNGEPTGATTPGLVTLAERPERLRLTLAGFEALDVPVSGAIASEPLRLSYTMHRVLLVTSTPSGAAIWIDSKDTGLTTPTELPHDERAAPQKIEFRLSGYVSQSHRPGPDEIRSGKLKTITLMKSGGPAPSPAPVTVVEVTAPYPVSLSGCGQNSAAVLKHIFSTSVECPLRVFADAVFWSRTWNIKADGVRQHIEAPDAVTVDLRTNRPESQHGACRIEVDGRHVGPTSPTPREDFSIGDHEFRIICDRVTSRGTFRADPSQRVINLERYIR